MGDRFVVVPVDGGVAAPAGQEPPEAAGGRAEAAGTSEADPQDSDGALPILEYNREPNRYGRTGSGLIRPVGFNQEEAGTFGLKLRHLFQFLFVFYLTAVIKYSLSVIMFSKAQHKGLR